MVLNIKQLVGLKIEASDGDIGKIRDFYFDDQMGTVRYAVVDTAPWESGRIVLISPHAFGPLFHQGLHLVVNLTRQQIANSPPIDAHKPVSRQFEVAYNRYYGWPEYWAADPVGGPKVSHLHEASRYNYQSPLNGFTEDSLSTHDAHLRSILAVEGYVVESTDGVIGHVADFLLDPQTWMLQDLIVKAGNWFFGKEIIVPMAAMKRISFKESVVFLNMTTKRVEDCPLHQVVTVSSVA